MSQQFLQYLVLFDYYFEDTCALESRRTIFVCRFGIFRYDTRERGVITLLYGEHRIQILFVKDLSMTNEKINEVLYHINTFNQTLVSEILTVAILSLFSVPASYSNIRFTWPRNSLTPPGPNLDEELRHVFCVNCLSLGNMLFSYSLSAVGKSV